MIGKCRVALIRHTMVPKLELHTAVYGVRLRRQILIDRDVKIDKIFLWTGQKYWKTSLDRWRYVQGIESPADIGIRGMCVEGLKEYGWLNGPAWLQTDEEQWPNPWCQKKVVEVEQATSTVATKTKLDHLFDWRRYSSLNRIRNFIACYMRFKTKLPECFKVDNKQQRNLNKLEHCPIITIHRGRWNNSNERLTKAFESRLQRKASNIINSKTSSRTSSVGESAA